MSRSNGRNDRDDSIITSFRVKMRLLSALVFILTGPLTVDSFLALPIAPFAVKQPIGLGRSVMTSPISSSTKLHLLPDLSTLISDADAVVQEAAKADNGEYLV